MEEEPMPPLDTPARRQAGRRNVIAAVAHAGPLASLGAIIGGIAGWLLSTGALPRPNFLPAPPGEPLQAACIFAALGLLGGGILGTIAYLADRAYETETASIPTPERR